jgi:hypothetical protein
MGERFSLVRQFLAEANKDSNRLRRVYQHIQGVGTVFALFVSMDLLDEITALLHRVQDFESRLGLRVEQLNQKDEEIKALKSDNKILAQQLENQRQYCNERDKRIFGIQTLKGQLVRQEQLAAEKSKAAPVDNFDARLTQLEKAYITLYNSYINLR